MKIADMRLTPIAVTDPPLLNAAGLHAPYALRTIVELVTDDNVCGLSEIPGDADVDRDLEAVRDLVVGRDPFHLSAIERAIDEHYGGREAESRGEMPWDSRRRSHVFSAIEVACLDIVGKAVGRPVVDLLGGKARDRVPFSAYLFYKLRGAGGELGFECDSTATGWSAARQEEALGPGQIVAQAREMVREFGFQALKLKGGVMAPEREVDTILALRDAFGPDVPLRFDPNGVWRVETAIEWGSRMEGVLEYLEDPVRDQVNMARVAKALKTPLATNMCTTSFEDIPESIRLGSEHIILSDHHFWGGLRASLELGRICRTFGRGLSMHSNSHVGISLAAMTHLAAAIPNLTHACDTHYPWQSEEVIAGGRLQFEDGSLPVPKGPGLGVELDRDALKKLHEKYKACGLTKRDDGKEMRRVHPDWEFKAVRW